MTQVEAIADILSLDFGSDPEPPRWFPWDPDNGVPFKSVDRGEGNGERRLAEELRLLGYTAERLGQNGTYDIDSSLGGIEVKEPDSGGRIVSAVDGYTTLSWLVDECLMVLRMFRMSGVSIDDDEFMAAMDAARTSIAAGRISTDTLAIVAATVEFLHAFFGSRPAALFGVEACVDPEPGAIDWVVDPSLFIADSIVFPSRSLSEGVAHVALVCEQGYCLVGRRALDQLFIFRDAARNGRPRFSSKIALPKFRRESIKRRIRASRDDKIKAIGQGAQTNVKREGEEET